MVLLQSRAATIRSHLMLWRGPSPLQTLPNHLFPNRDVTSPQQAHSSSCRASSIPLMSLRLEIRSLASLRLAVPHQYRRQESGHLGRDFPICFRGPFDHVALLTPHPSPNLPKRVQVQRARVRKSQPPPPNPPWSRLRTKNRLSLYRARYRYPLRVSMY